MKLLYIQTIIPEYRNNTIIELAKRFDLHIIAQKLNEDSGHKAIENSLKNFHEEKTKSIFFGLIKYQSNTIKNIRKINPEIILSHSDIKNISCWIAMIYSKFKGIPYYSYGHGPYKKNKNLLLYKIIYKIAMKLHSGYIAYNEFSKLSFERLDIRGSKLHHINNTIKIIDNPYCESKTGKENGILFIGRIRENSNLELLVDACENLRASGENITLHIIGHGEYYEKLRLHVQLKPWVTLYGKIFDQKHINEISKNCRIGCYPGSAGLSVVHYFALGLPPIVKKSMINHMGPEPAYVVDNVNGFHFNQDSDLYKTLLKILSLSKNEYIKISNESINTYKKLSLTNFAESFEKIHASNK